MRNIFIFEDDQKRIDQFKKYLKDDNLVITDNIDIAKKILKDQTFDVALLDHDMDHQIFVESTSKNTGFQVASFIVQENIPFHQVIVHSHNPVGAENMMHVLNKYGTNIKNLHRVPFADLIGILKFSGGK